MIIKEIYEDKTQYISCISSIVIHNQKNKEGNNSIFIEFFDKDKEYDSIRVDLFESIYTKEENINRCQILLLINEDGSIIETIFKS